MRLDLAVTLPGADEPESFTVDLSELDPDDTRQAIELVGGAAPISALSEGRWNPLGARALVYVAMCRQLKVDFDFEDLDLDFGDLGAFLEDQDAELEASIPMEKGDAAP